MKFLPYEHLRIKTRLSVEEVRKRVEETTEPKRLFRWFEVNHKPYQGKIEGSHFEVSRIIHYRNSFLPKIKGEIQADVRGCSIDLRMYPHELVMVFTIFWLGSIGFFFLRMLGAFLSSGTASNTGDLSTLLIPAGLLLFGYVLIVGGFKFESTKSKTFFHELFQAEEVEEMGMVNPFGVAG